MATVDPLLVETIEAMLADHCTPERVGAAEGGLDAALWRTLSESGLDRVGVAEAAGGSGGTLHDAAAIAKVAGRFAAPVPLVETSLMAGWVCEAAGLELGDGPLAVVIGDGRRTPWAPVAGRFVIVADGGVAVVDGGDVTIGSTGVNYAGEPWADVTAAGVTLSDGPSPIQARARGALGRALLSTGALQQAVELSVQYANEREQFGRPIGKFQILQHYLAEMAGESAVAEAVADTAVDVITSGAADSEVTEVIAAAKAATGRAAGIINRLAHQLHGAIGYTDEHRLQYSTRRLWAWRDEHGTEAEWAATLGRSLVDAGGAALWPTLTSWPRAAAG